MWHLYNICSVLTIQMCLCELDLKLELTISQIVYICIETTKQCVCLRCALVFAVVIVAAAAAVVYLF